MMIHEENKINWGLGSIVIHDSDSKDHKMLMVVVGGIQTDDVIMLETEYLNPMEIIPNCLKRQYGDDIPKKIMSHYTTRWLNDIKYLHDPARFNIEVTEADKAKIDLIFGDLQC
mgnify:CR=1 FL=1